MRRPADRLISVVVPIYGGEEFVDQCIDSLVSQTHKNLEIILVNDGSPDLSGQICDLAASRDKRIRVIHQRNSGLVSARKAGVSVATGEYLGFVDGDDWVGPEFYEMLHELMANNEADLVISGHIRDLLGKQERIPPKLKPGVYERSDIEDKVLPTAISCGNFFQHGVSTYVWNKLFKRKEASHFVQEIPQEIVIGEDASLTYPYLNASKRLVVSPEGDYFYRQRPRSILSSIPDIESEFLRLSLLFQYLKKCLTEPDLSTNVTDQLRQYFYALVLLRSGGVITGLAADRWFTPFPELSRNQRIVIYSSGSFGQHLNESLKKLGFFEIVGWIDEDFQESQRLGLPVTALESVTGMEFDLILIASIDEEYRKRATNKLQELGVESDNISAIRLSFPAMALLLSEVGFDLDSFSFAPKTLH